MVNDDEDDAPPYVMREEVRDRGGLLEAIEKTPDGWRTCMLAPEGRELARRILGRDPETVAEVFAAQDAIESHARAVLTRQRRRWITWLEMHRTETGAELAARVRANEVL